MTQSRGSLSRRLVVGAVVWIALSLGGCGILLSYVFAQTVRIAFEENLSAELRAVIAALDVDTAQGVTVSVPLDDARYRQVFSGWYWQITTADGFISRSRSLWDEALPPPPSLVPGQTVYFDLDGPRAQRLRAAAIQVSRADAADINIVAAMDTAPLNAQIQRLNRIIFMALGTLGFGLALAVVLQVTVGLQPLRRVIAELKSIREGGRQRLAGDYPLEIAPLADAFNDVRDHDAETLARARREVGNLAHSLKTPLAHMLTDLTLVPHESRIGLTRLVQELQSKIDFHAARAATAAARGTTAQRVALSRVATDITTGLSRIHIDKGLICRVKVAEDLVVLAEEEDITEILGNLIDNAFKWARTCVEVAAARENSDSIAIHVHDDGPGVPDTMVSEIMKGRRLDESVPGSGLGLQIVHDIARAYGGILSLQRSPLGGLHAFVRLPSKTAATILPA